MEEGGGAGWRGSRTKVAPGGGRRGAECRRRIEQSCGRRMVGVVVVVEQVWE